jgi:hypothetical protein
MDLLRGNASTTMTVRGQRARHTYAPIEAVTTAMLESDYTHAESRKPAPEVPVRVFLKSQLMAALRQHARPIVIEDPDLALPFTRMLRARELRLRAVGGLVAEAMSYAISRHYNANVEAHWYIGQYVLPGNVQRIILKPKALPFRALGPIVSAHCAGYRQ